MFFRTRMSRCFAVTVAALAMLLSRSVMAQDDIFDSIGGGEEDGASDVEELPVSDSAAGVVSGEEDENAGALVTEAMDAYSNLEMERAKELLDQAIALGDSLSNNMRSKIHSSMGIISISGYSDAAAGQIHFIKATCYNDDAKVDPLFSTPEIDLIFTQAKDSTTVQKCEEYGIFPPWAGPKITPCGNFRQPTEQKKSTEVPFYLDVAALIEYQIDRLVLYYSYDSGKYQDVTMTRKSGNGFGAMLECEAQELRVNNPNEITYYIEGIGSDGSVICGQGNDEFPLTLTMTEGASPLPPVGGMSPQECLQCVSGDVACQKKLAAITRGDARDGDACTTDNDCVMGLICDPSLFTCATEPYVEPKKEEVVGPSKFYVALGGGSGGGYLNTSVSISRPDFPPTDGNREPNRPYDPREIITGQPEESPLGIIRTSDEDTSGFAWAGVPIRLALGYQITPKLAVEVSGRFDAYVTSSSPPRSCYDAAGGDFNQMINNANAGYCNITFDRDAFSDEQIVEMGKVAMETTPDPNDSDKKTVVLHKKYQYAWLVNARVRYRFITSGSFVASVFGGVGYGHIQYLVPDKENKRKYFPLPGMVDIEIGPGIAYYFNNHVGFFADVPIDFLVGDGFAVNFDLNVGLVFGF